MKCKSSKSKWPRVTVTEPKSCRQQKAKDIRIGAAQTMVDENCNKIAGPPRSKFPPKREGLKPPQIITDKSKIFDLSDDGDKKLSDDSSKSPPKKKGNVTPEISDHKSRAFDLLDGGVHSKRSYSLKPSTKGMLVSTLFALATFVRPIHILVPFLMILYGGFIFSLKGYLIALVFLLSFFIPPKPAPYLVSGLLSPILDYFQYDEIVENSPIHIQESINDGCQYIYACQPHGIVPFCSIAWSIRQAQQNRKISPTAVAWMVLATPILKHVMGIFGCVTTRQMINELKRKETSSVRLYVGSTAEIFYCTENIEVLELTKRKQFIHLALQMGIDVIPVYMFGNSTLFSVWKHKVLIKISEFVQFPFSYVWGRYGLPIPRQQKLLYVIGQPLGLPHIKRPRPFHVNRWHQRYCEEVQRLFEQYKEQHPDYKNKKLVIV